MSIVKLDNIDLVRQQVPILQSVSWTIEAGQHWALLGSNGAGKTSLLKVLTGYEWPTEGTVNVLGQTYGQCHLPELRKRLGWVSASLEHRLPLRHSVARVVASGFEASIGLYRELSEDQWRKVDAVLEQLGMARFRDQPYGLLSQGEQQRVVIARAMVCDPAVLILDEPCAGLDPAARDEFLEDLGTLVDQRRDLTMILVTHHIEEIMPFISHVLVLKAGQIQASGVKSSVLTSAGLSAAFGRRCHVDAHDGRYWLRLDSPGKD